MATLYIRLFSKAAADSAEHWSALPCRFALVADSGAAAVEQEGFAPLGDLADVVRRAQRVVLMFAASDVSLLRVRVPPMSAARLRAALPNLVEEQLIADPADCAMVAGPAVDGMRTVAVVQRAWLEILSTTLSALGARGVSAIPAQLCLPFQAGMVSAAVTQQDEDLELTLRLSDLEGIGLSIASDGSASAAREVLDTLLAVVPTLPVTLFVPALHAAEYRDAAHERELPDERLAIYDDEWSRWIQAARGVRLDLMPALGKAGGPQFVWRPWRWPLVLAGMLLAVNVAAINIEWWDMKNEAATLRADMTRIYRSAYPQETVIVDPLAQMRQKVAAGDQSGRPVPGDFTFLLAAFGEAWQTVARSQPVVAGAPIAVIEYRERTLLVRLKPDANVAIEPMQRALTARNLSLSPAPGGDAAVWEIRSAP